MRAVYCGLLLVLFNALFLCADSLDHDHGHDHGHDHNVTSKETTPEPTKEATPVCLTTNRTEEDLLGQLRKLEECHTDKSNDLRQLVDDAKPYNDTSKRIKAIRTCFEAYVENVTDCYLDVLTMWNTTIHMLTEVEDYLCGGSIVCDNLRAFYLQEGASCGSSSNVSSCGNSIMTTLLFHQSYKEVVQMLLALDYTPDHCKKESEAGSCAIDKLKNCGHDQTVPVIAEGLQKRIMSATCGGACSLHSSFTLWLFLVALYSAQRLLS